LGILHYSFNFYTFLLSETAAKIGTAKEEAAAAEEAAAEAITKAAS
jgi:hypothetical protein